MVKMVPILMYNSNIWLIIIWDKGRPYALMNSQGESQLNLALASSLGTICREPDVDIVRSWNIRHSEYGGKLGLYKIAAKACALLSSLKLNKLMNKNLNAISFDDESIKQGQLLWQNRK